VFLTRAMLRSGLDPDNGDGQRADGGGAGRRRADPAGMRYRAMGRMTILDIVVPSFGPADERLD
jgi:hypothetical protein